MIRYTDGSLSEPSPLKELFEKNARKPEDIAQVLEGDFAKLSKQYSEEKERQEKERRALVERLSKATP